MENVSSNTGTYQIAAFYHFQTIPSDKVESLGQAIEDLGTLRGLRGLIIMASEGVNGTISGETQEQVVSYLAEVSAMLGFPVFLPKWSVAPAWPFRRFKVRLREEIVTLGKPEVQPLPPKSQTHLSPEEWHRVMTEEDVLVLDTRNWYETRIGKFEGAVDPNLEEFREFSRYLEEGVIPKEKKILIYCTGGIRCEKAITEMHNQGFKNVYQLDGGILNYIEKFPNGKFQGECFVFDHRVAVDQNLQPSKIYRMCPHCGQPAVQKISCLRCDTETVVCDECVEHDHFKTCSKNCAYHYQQKPGKKGLSQEQGVRYALTGRLRPGKARAPKTLPKNG